MRMRLGPDDRLGGSLDRHPPFFLWFCMVLVSVL